MEKKIEHKITEEQLQALFQGKKLVLDYQGRPKITLYPPNYGIFMTWQKYQELEKRIWNQAWEPARVFMDELRKQFENL